jgi:hypothetical protein
MSRAPKTPPAPPGTRRIPVTLAVAEAIQRYLDQMLAAQGQYRTAAEVALASVGADLRLPVLGVDPSESHPAIFVQTPSAPISRRPPRQLADGVASTGPS